MEPAAATAPTRATQGTVLALVCATRLLDFTLRMGIVPFFPELAGRFDISYAAVGGIFSAFFIGYAALQLPFGWMADRWPEHRLIAAGVLGLGAGALAFLHADTWQGAAAARLFMGAATAATAVPGIRLAATATPPERRGYALGLLETAIGASNLLALSGFPLLARWVAVDSLTLAPAVATVPLAAAILWIGSPPRPEARATGSSGRQPALVNDLRQVLALFVLGFLGLMAYNGFMGWAPTYLRQGLGYAPSAAAAAMAAAMAIYVPTAYLSGNLSDRFGRRIPVINAGSAVMGVAYLSLAFGGAGPAVVYAGALLWGIGGGSSMPALVAFSTEALGAARAGLATGLMQVAAQVGAAVSGVVYGAVVDFTGGFTGVWWLGAALLAVRIVSSRLAAEQPADR